MKIFRRIATGLGIVSIPIMVGFPVASLSTPEATTALTPREALLSQITSALEAPGLTALDIGLVPALLAAGLVLIAVLWLVLRQRPAEAPVRPHRSTRAELAVDLLQGGETPDRVMVRAHVSRDAIELLRHTTMGHPVA